MSKTRIRVEVVALPSGKAEERIQALASLADAHVRKIAEWQLSTSVHKTTWGNFK